MKIRRLKIQRRSFRSGLTLIELGVVVLILGAIIAIVAININPGELKDDTAGLKLKKDASELQMHLERYAQKFGTYPTPEQGLQALYEQPTVGDVPPNWSPIVKNKQATLDPWKTPYILRLDDSGEMAIISLGKDQKEGGEGKNADFNILNENEYPTAFKK